MRQHSDVVMFVLKVEALMECARALGSQYVKIFIVLHCLAQQTTAPDAGTHSGRVLSSWEKHSHTGYYSSRFMHKVQSNKSSLPLSRAA